MRGVLSDLLPRARTVQAAAPTDAAAYRLLLVAAALSKDSASALEAVKAEPSPLLLVGDTGVRRAQAWVDLAILWERFGELDGADRALVAVGPATADPRLAESHGVIAAVRARLGDRARWNDAAALFNAAAQRRLTPALLNNLGVALVELGRPDEAREVWAKLGQPGARYGLVDLHDAVVTRNLEALEVVANSDDEQLQFLAVRWLVHLSPKASQSQWKARLPAAEAAARAASLRPALSPGPVGVVLKGEFNFNLHYDARNGLDLGIAITTTPWLTLRPGDVVFNNVPTFGGTGAPPSAVRARAPPDREDWGPAIRDLVASGERAASPFPIENYTRRPSR